MSLAIEETMTDQSVWRGRGEFGVSMTVYMYEEVHAQLHGHSINDMSYTRWFVWFTNCKACLIIILSACVQHVQHFHYYII